MKLDGRISILISSDCTRIAVEDKNASVTFVNVKLTPEQLSRALSRQMSVECEVVVNGLEKLGKKHENKIFEFEIDKDKASRKFEDELQEIAQSKLSDGWIAERYFGSQTSFFKKEDKQYARVTIRRWN